MPEIRPGYEESIEIPEAWESLDIERLAGTLMVVGAPDAGKSTFARYLFWRLHTGGVGPVAFLDGDPGQSRLGPPTTVTLSFNADAAPAVGGENTWRYFVSSTTPRGHMLTTLVGAGRLTQAARAAGARVILYDTSGLIDPTHGGLALKSAKIDLLQPTVVFAIQRDQELEPLLVPLRRSHRTRVVTLPPAAAARRRETGARRVNRAEKYAEHFSGARPLVANWTRMAVFPLPRFSLNRLVALEDDQSFTLALGIVTEIDRANRQVTLLTPLRTLEKVSALRLGDVQVDPHTFRDERPA